MPVNDLTDFMSHFKHGGASEWIRSKIYEYLENPPPPPTMQTPLSESDVRRIVRDEIAKASPWVDS